MKTSTLIIILAFSITTFVSGQKQLSGSGYELSLEQSKKIDEIVEGYEVFQLDLNDWNNKISFDRSSRMLWDFTDERSYDLTLNPNDIRSPSYVENFSDSDRVLSKEKGKSITYKGSTDTGGEVRLAITDNFFYGLIETKQGYMVLDQLQYFIKDSKIPPNIIVMYPLALLKEDGRKCGNSEIANKIKESLPKSESAGKVTTSCRILEIATDADFEYWSDHGNNSNNRILAEFNNIQATYANTFNIQIMIVNQNVWTTAADPYSSTNIATINNEIATTWDTTFSNVDKDLICMFTGKSLGGILGRSTGPAPGDVCNNDNANNYTVDRASAFLSLGHEIGHNFDGRHGDGDLCGTGNASVMCQGEKRDPIYFTPASITRIGNYISANSGCLFDFNGISDISGNGSMCINTTRTYTIDIPTGATIAWSLTNSKATIISGQGTNSVTVRGQSNGSVQLRASVDLNINGCQNVLIRKGIAVGTLIPADFRLRDPSTNVPVYTLCRNQPTYVKAAHDDGINPIEWDWNVSGAYITYDNSYSDHSRVTLRPFSNNATVQIRARNSCGWSGWAGVSPGIITCGGFFAVYPNPSSSDVFISENLNQDEANTDMESKQIGEIQLELYDLNGIMVKSGSYKGMSSNPKISVSGLNKGIYVLKIAAKGVDESHRIVVE